MLVIIYNGINEVTIFHAGEIGTAPLQESDHPFPLALIVHRETAPRLIGSSRYPNRPTRRAQ
jgi:hypothetical protein